PETASGFLWARDGWYGGEDDQEWSGGHDIHRGVSLANTDTNGAPWSGGWVPFDFEATQFSAPTYELELGPHQPFSGDGDGLAPALRDLPLPGWIPFESAGSFGQEVLYDEEALRPGISASAGVAIVMAGGDASRVRPVENVYPLEEPDDDRRVRLDIPIDAERFAATSARLDGEKSRIVDEDALVAVVFGGALADGSYDDRLFIAEISADGADLVADWMRVSPSGGSPAPAGRADAVLAFEPRLETLVLIGGENESGVLGDVWLFDGATGWWQEDGFSIPDGFAVSRAAQARAGERLLLYGGVDEDETPTSELWSVDLRDRTVEQLATPAGGPGPRSGAAMVADGDGSLWLFVGEDELDVLHDDLWRLDTEAEQWTQVRGDCDGPRCPGGRSAALTMTRDGRPLVVGGYTGATSGEDAYELSSGRWVGSDEVLGLAESSRDCDGDQVPEPGYGRLCRAQSKWWAPVGKLVCAEDGGLVCNAEGASVTRHRWYPMPAVRAVEPALERGVAFALGCQRVDVLRAVRGEKLTRLARVWLDDRGNDVGVLGDRLVVGTDSGLSVFDVSDPESPVAVFVEQSGSAVYEVDSFGGSLSVLSQDGLETIRFGEGMEAPPEVAGTLEIEDLRAHEPWFGIGLGFTPPGRLLLAGKVAFVSGALGLFTVDVADQAWPELVSYSCAGVAPGAIRYSDGVVYGAGPLRPLLDMREDVASPSLELGHDVRHWARGRELGAGVAVEAGLLGVRMVELEAAP
ncbi:MAG: kelch repeat-containing protein, partial [Polyangia bacterium]